MEYIISIHGPSLILSFRDDLDRVCRQSQSQRLPRLNAPFMTGPSLATLKSHDNGAKVFGPEQTSTDKLWGSCAGGRPHSKSRSMLPCSTSLGVVSKRTSCGTRDRHDLSLTIASLSSTSNLYNQHTVPHQQCRKRWTKLLSILPT